eukprot:441233_1
MDFITCKIFDRVVEDAILLYDAYKVYEKLYPRPPVNVMISAIRKLMSIEYVEGKPSIFSSPSRDMLYALETDGYTEPEDLKGPEEMILSSGFVDGIRYILTSILSDLAVLPLWQVQLSAIAQRERIRGLLPFHGFVSSLRLIYETEGFKGLFKGYVPVCTGGILRYYYRQGRIFRELYPKPFERLPWMLDVHSAQYESESIISLVFKSTLLHPFDLITTRMITEDCLEYESVSAAIKTVIKTSGVSGLFEGIHLSISNSILLNAIIPFGNWYMLGVPFLLKTRRMLEGMDLIFNVGLSGSVNMLRDILRRDGFSGLFAGSTATFYGIIPAICSLCLARGAIYLALGSRYECYNRRKRRKFLRSVILK